MPPNDAAIRPVIVYDGACPFCRKQVARIRRRDRNGVFEFVPKQTPGLTVRFPRLAEGDFNTGMRLIDPDGTIHVGADAVYEIARRLPLSRWVAPLYRVPPIRWAARRFYGWIAANRYRFSRRECDMDCPLDEEPRTPKP